MQPNSNQNDRESLLRHSLHAIQLLEEKLDKNDKAKPEPIAVIGMACRFPGGCMTPETYWKFLKEKGDGIIEVPPDRWDVDAYYDPNPAFDKIYIRQAGFLQENVGEFDARFFKISPLEAIEMDPQQRLLLETSWEALERAGQNPERLKGSKTGVFIGIIGADYFLIPRDKSKTNLYAGTGTLTCVASGRIAYFLGLHGPAISIDTACSSSLVSVHYACESLRKGESNMALAGGVNLILSTVVTTGLCMSGALAKDGKCKPFDADGDGYGRGDGCGMLVLKRLSDAQKDGDPILALIRGGAVNNDGPSSGLTVPNGVAQKAVITEALENANILPNDVSYLEAHGTGTALGDPIEMKAITEVFGKGRKNPLTIGSVKGNIGHLEAASGIAGLIKVILCLHNREIPPNINLNTMNPRIRLEQIPALISTEVKQWNLTDEKTRVAGISSFGFSGTNAHLVLSEAPSLPDEYQMTDNSPLILALSAKSEKALNHLVSSYKEHLKTHSQQLGDVCYTANVCRAHFSHRAVFIAKDAPEMQKRLEMFCLGEGDISSGQIEEGVQPKVVFIFRGNSDGIVDIARKLYETLPFYQHQIESSAKLFAPYLEDSILKWISSEAKTQETPTADVNKACLFLTEYALCKLWETWGIKPSAVWGEGIGIYVAASIVGVMSLETAVKYVMGDVNNLSGEVYKAPRCRFIADASGKPVKKSVLKTSAYWQKRPVSTGKFEAGITVLSEQGYHLLELKQLSNAQFSIREALLKYLGQLYCVGADIQWQEYEQDFSHHKVVIPTYPFERKYYWVALPSEGEDKPEDVKQKILDTSDPLEGNRVHSFMNNEQFEYQYQLSIDRLPELNDTHGVVHVGYYQEMLFQATETSFNTTSFIVSEIEFLVILMVSDIVVKNVHLILEPDKKTGKTKFQFCSRSEDDQQWEVHVKGSLQLNQKPALPEMSSELLDEIKQRCMIGNDSGPGFYQMMQDRGMQFGPSVQWVDEIWFCEGEALARLRTPTKKEKDKACWLKMHPGILDACAQVFHAALSKDIAPDMKYMVVKWEDFVSDGVESEGELWCHVSLNKNSAQDDSIYGKFQLFDKNGKGVCQIQNSQMKGLSSDRMEALKAVGSSQQELNEELLEKLRSVSSEQKRIILAEYLQKTMADILLIPVSELDLKEPLRNLGMDSLVGLKFKKIVEDELEVNIPMDLLIEGPSISLLTDHAVTTFMEDSEEQTDSTFDSLSQEKEPDSQLWFNHRKINPDSRYRLFCLPYGDGGASMYRKWQEKLPDDIEVCPIQLPGRENRLRETPIDNINDIIEELEKVLMPELDRPFGLYGHSMGALIAFRVAYRLWKNAEVIPAHLFVSAFSSPLIYPNPYLKEKIDEYEVQSVSEFTDKLAAKVIARKGNEVKKALLPTTVADLKLVGSYKQEKENPFNVPITAFHGENDDRVKVDEMSAWKELTTATFKQYTLPGDHFFLHEDQSQERLLALITENIDVKTTFLHPSSDPSNRGTKVIIPSKPDEITPEWLSDALRSSGILKNASVIAVEIEKISDVEGFLTSVVRVKIKYDSKEDGVPTSVIAKLSSSDPHLRIRLSRLGFYENEIRFYRDIADQVEIRTPKCYYDKIDTTAYKFMLLLEDLAPIAYVGDNVTECSYQEAELAMTYIASFHANFWDNSKLKVLNLQLFDKDVEGIEAYYRDNWLVFKRKHKDHISKYFLEVAEAFADKFPVIWHQLGQIPQTLIHGDFRLDNIFFGRSDTTLVTVVDWQLMMRGSGLCDVTYFINWCVGSDMRREMELKLLSKYHSTLVEKGVSNYTFEQCLNDYHLSLFYSLQMIMHFSKNAIGNRGEALTSAALERLSATMQDHSIIELLQK